MSIGELALLDTATRQAERDVQEMIERLERVNRRLDAVFSARATRVESAQSRSGRAKK